MKSIDFKSFIIGILLSVVMFLLIGADNKMSELGNITVDSITIRNGLQILNKNEEKAVSIYSKAGGGVLKMYNKFGKNTAYLGTGGGDKGGFKIYDKNGGDIAFISATKSNKGFIQIYNSDSKSIAKLSADENNSGLLTLKDNEQKIIFESNNIENDSQIDLSMDDLSLGNLIVKSLTVSDEEGNTRGSLSIDENNNGKLFLSNGESEVILPNDDKSDNLELSSSVDTSNNLGDIRVNSISIFDNDEKLKLKIGIDEENSGFLQVTNEVEDYFYPSGLDDIDLMNFEDISVKSITVKDDNKIEKVFLGINDENDGFLRLNVQNEEIKYPRIDSNINILENKNLGNITVSSIIVLNENDKPTTLIGNTSEGSGEIQVRNNSGENILFSSNNSIQKGDNLGEMIVTSLEVVNEDNETMLTLGEHKAGYGVLKAHNPVGDIVFSSDDIKSSNNDINTTLSDDIQVKSVTIIDDNGKKIGYFGSSDNGKSELSMYNNFQDIALTMGTSISDGGKINFFDSVGKEIFNINDETKNVYMESISTSKISSKHISSELINSKDINIENLEASNIISKKILVNNLEGDNKVMIGIDNKDRGSINTFLPNNNVDFNSTSSQTPVLDNIQAKSLTILTDDGDKRIVIGTDEYKNGIINIENEFGISTNTMKSDMDGNGSLIVSNHTGQAIISLNRGEGDGGKINLYNRNNENIAQIGVDESGKTGKISRINNLEIMNQYEYVTSKLGNDNNGQGSLTISNQDGVLSTTLGTLSTGGGLVTYNSNGKITSFLGTNDNNGGILMSFNKHAKRTSYLGTNKNDFGMILLSSKGGVVRWGKEGNE